MLGSELAWGILQAASVKFSITRQTLSRLWKGWRAACATALNGEWGVTSKKKGTGRGLKYNCDDIAQAVCELPLRSRSTVQLLEGALHISSTRQPPQIQQICFLDVPW
jgi:hypothetical protein